MTDIRKLAAKHSRGMGGRGEGEIYGSIVHALQEYEKQIAEAIEPYLPEQEYGWEWASSPSYQRVIHGSDSKESAERAMESIAKTIAPVRIMVRDKAVPGEWREA